MIKKEDKENPDKKKPFGCIMHVKNIVIGLVHCDVKKVKNRVKIKIKFFSFVGGRYFFFEVTCFSQRCACFTKCHTKKIKSSMDCINYFFFRVGNTLY